LLEPLWARIIGGLAGALCFALCVLLFGPRIGIAIALAGSTIAIFISSLAFGEALVRSARPQWAASPKEQEQPPRV
jgi:uncharacterized membrane protein YdjX (TVP38/TMEM64 family)